MFFSSGVLVVAIIQVQFIVIPSFKYLYLKGYYSANFPEVMQEHAKMLLFYCYSILVLDMIYI